MGVRSLSLGGLSAKEAEDQLREFVWDEGPGFILTSPERTETDGFLEYLLSVKRSRLALVAIDEAHCISQWGHDFRPTYKALPGFLDRAFGRGGWPTLLCLTATLDRNSQAEIVADFRMGLGDVIRSKVTDSDKTLICHFSATMIRSRSWPLWTPCWKHIGAKRSSSMST